MADRGYRGRPQRGERADRQINAGHSRGLDAALSKLKTERIYAFGQNGKEISHSTRPGEGLSNNIAGRIGRTFSGADISVAVQHNASEIRAITGIP